MISFFTELGIPEEATTAFIAMIAIIIGISAVIGLIFYLLKAISVYKMAKTSEIKNPWTAFVPVANSWTLGTLAEKYKKKNGVKAARFGIILPILEGIVLLQCIALTVFAVISVKEIAVYALDAVNTSADMAPDRFISLIPVIILYFSVMATAVAYAIIQYVALWRVYASFDNSNATLYIVLSVLFSVSVPIILFIIRNRKPEFDPHNNMPYFSGTF